jgi:tetrahydromethanopterin S-methyltransferase subunit G
MSRTHLFFKVEVEHDAGENPQRLGEEICRQIQRVYGVRLAELSSLTKVDE